ncbi:MAG: NCS2 family permease [Deltaproteobacteria bacterium]|nr:NCS2 family permease [Deltaproteobacteria bacterium]
MGLRTFFDLDALGTTFRTEIVAGVTTFMTMSYILVVNPQLLSAAGMPFDGVLFATCVSSALATTLMALLARYPIALAPGMGLNAYFAFVVTPHLAKILGSQEAAWHAALGAVFFSGSLFLILSVFKARERIVDAIPTSLKLAISGGIGLFIAMIGFQNGALIKAHPKTLVTLGDIHSTHALLTLLGLLIIGILLARGVKAAALIGILTITVIAIFTGDTPAPSQIVALPRPHGTFLALDLAGAWRAGLAHIVFAFFFVDLFDTIGTLVGVAEQGDFLDEDGKLPRASGALLADALGTLVGALLGTSTVTSYIESASGIAAGGRSGLASLVTAALFAVALLFSPLLRVVPPMATAPVLIVVGALMIRNVKRIAWDDISEALPAFLTLAGIAFSFSIADGMALGFIAYALIKALAGKHRDVRPTMWILAGLFALRYAFLQF